MLKNNNKILLIFAVLLVLSIFFLTKTFVSREVKPQVAGIIESYDRSSGLVRIQERALRKPLSRTKEKAIKKWIENMETTVPESTFQE